MVPSEFQLETEGECRIWHSVFSDVFVAAVNAGAPDAALAAKHADAAALELRKRLVSARKELAEGDGLRAGLEARMTALEARRGR